MTTMNAIKAGRAGHCAVAIDNRMSVLVFGGQSIDKESMDYRGDNVYHDDLFWLRTEWDLKRRAIKANRMNWWGPLKFAGPKASARSDHTCDKVTLGRGAGATRAVIIFGGYNGGGRCCGYFNDLHAIINVEQNPSELIRLRAWLRKVQWDDLSLYARRYKNVTAPKADGNWSIPDYDNNKTRVVENDKHAMEKLFLTCKDKGVDACRMLFNKRLPPPWEDHA
jgi:hypothetical protein